MNRRVANHGLILGVNIAAGTAYFALLKPPKTPMLEDPIKMAPSDSYSGPTRLKDFSDRFVQDVRRLNVAMIAVARTRLHAGWVYAQAFDRISLEVAMMLASKQAQVEYRSVRQVVETARAAGIGNLESVDVQLAKALGVDGVRHWKDRSVALMVALAAAKGLGE